MNDVHDLLIGLLGAFVWAVLTWVFLRVLSRVERRRLRVLWPFWDDRKPWFRGSRRTAAAVRAVVATSTEMYQALDATSAGIPLIDPHLKPGTGIGQVRALAALAPSVHRAWPEAVGLGDISFSRDVALDGRTHLILVGGPRTNSVTADYLDKILTMGRAVDGGGLPFEQRDSTIYWNGRAYSATSGVDYGLVVRAPNPLRTARRVVVFSGASTFGTEAAARWYVGDVADDDRSAWKSWAASSGCFAALVQVTIASSGEAGQPTLVRGVDPVTIRATLEDARQVEPSHQAPFDVVEHQVVGKAVASGLCEDALVMSDWFVGVVDGATDVTGHRYGGRTGGRLAAEVLVEAASAMDPDVDAAAAIAVLNAALVEAVGDARADGPSAAVTLVSARRREVWQIGDVAWWRVDGEDPVGPSPKPIDVVTGNVRAAVIERSLGAGDSVESLLASYPDVGREAARPVLRAQHALRNAAGPWAYGAIDGRPVPPALVTVTRLPDDELELVICSDGYPRPARTLAEAEAELARLLAEDALCIGPLRGAKGVRPGDRSFDDRAYLRVILPSR